jgi:hypothetical protein
LHFKIFDQDELKPLKPMNLQYIQKHECFMDQSTNCTHKFPSFTTLQGASKYSSTTNGVLLVVCVVEADHFKVEAIINE